MHVRSIDECLLRKDPHAGRRFSSTPVRWMLPAVYARSRKCPNWISEKGPHVVGGRQRQHSVREAWTAWFQRHRDHLSPRPQSSSATASWRRVMHRGAAHGARWIAHPDHTDAASFDDARALAKARQTAKIVVPPRAPGSASICATNLESQRIAWERTACLEPPSGGKA